MELNAMKEREAICDVCHNVAAWDRGSKDGKVS